MVRRENIKKRVTSAKKESFGSERNNGQLASEDWPDGKRQLIVPILMFGSITVGVVLIISNYLVTFSAIGMPSDIYLIVGLLFILIGIMTATKLQ